MGVLGFNCCLPHCLAELIDRGVARPTEFLSAWCHNYSHILQCVEALLCKEHILNATVSLVGNAYVIRQYPETGCVTTKPFWWCRQHILSSLSGQINIVASF